MKSRRARHQVRVLYQDTDQAKVVHHATYFRYLEAGRLEMWRHHGFSYDAFEKTTGLGLPVVEANLRYRAAGRFDDLLDIETWVSAATRASIWFDATVHRANPGEERVLLVEASVRLACASFSDGQIRRIPDVILDACLEPGHGV